MNGSLAMELDVNLRACPEQRRENPQFHGAPWRLFLRGTIALLLFCGGVARESMAAGGEAAPPPPASRPGHARELVEMLREIDPRRIENDIRKLVSFGTRNTLSVQDDPAHGIGAARDWLCQELQTYSQDSGGRLKVEQQVFEQQPGRFARIQKPTRLCNLVATLPGLQPESQDRIYVVSGHYDSMCGSPTDPTCDAPGANDDASGTAAVLELARVMSKRHFDATILFLAVAGEEQGLVGATYFAEQARNRNWHIDAMFTDDIIGNSTGANGLQDANTVRLFAEGVPSNETPAQAAIRRNVGGENDSPSRELARFIKETVESCVPDFRVWMIYRRDRYLRGGDHIPFLENGYPAVRFTEPNENYAHQHQTVRLENGVQYGDLPRFVDFDYVVRVARANCAALAELALAPAPPVDLIMVIKRLTVDTELEWKPNREPDLAGYEVVWRDTIEPLWTHARWLGNVTNCTLPALSKDNFFFGVRAVDREGHRSVVRFPRPQR
jgi:hypothetical protein